VLDLGSGRATIVPNHDENEAGHSVTFDRRESIDRWERSGRDRSEDASLRAGAMMLMAGRLAEIELLGRCGGGDGDNRRR
jgi:hypothetical protein